MASLLPTLTAFFFFLFLSTSNALSATTSPEDDVIDWPGTSDGLAGVSDSKSNILLPTEKLSESHSGSLVNIDVDGQKDPQESGKLSAVPTEIVGEKEMPASGSFDSFHEEIVDGGEKRLEKEKEFRLTALTWHPINRHFDRMRMIRRSFPAHRRHRGPRFDGGAQIWPERLPLGEEEEKDVVEGEHHRHRHRHRRRHRRHHGEIFSARWIDGGAFNQLDLDAVTFPDVDGEGMMIGEFKHPRFFLHRHHHHYDHRHRRHHEEDEEEEIEEHKERKGHGLWKKIRKFLTHL